MITIAILLITTGSTVLARSNYDDYYNDKLDKKYDNDYYSKGWDNNYKYDYKNEYYPDWNNKKDYNYDYKDYYDKDYNDKWYNDNKKERDYDYYNKNDKQSGGWNNYNRRKLIDHKGIFLYLFVSLINLIEHITKSNNFLFWNHYRLS